jgi:hypothetical protein
MPPSLGKEESEGNMTKRKFHKTTFVLTVLSEEPLSGDEDLLELHNMTDTGDCVGDLKCDKTEEMDGKQAADALYEARSEPSFFMLDDKGNDDE